ncbi:MAG: hypothetical protein LBG80_13845, partial [Bacteroidales bacterium]|nr:hypothetical protein [Bacteroidales bacterium]
MNIKWLLLFVFNIVICCNANAQQNISVCYNDSIRISFTDTSTTNKYLWQTKNSGSQTWNTVKNWSLDTFVDLTNLVSYLDVRYLRDTNDNQIAEDTILIANVTVYSQISAGVINGIQTICYNTAPTQFAFTTNPSGAGISYSYQWFESNNGTSFTAISNATNNTYLSGNLIATKYYKVVVTSQICGTTDTSNIVTVTVRDEFIAGQIAGMDTICYNTIPNQLTMISNCTGGNVPYLYQWQQSFDNINFSNIGSATNTTYQPTTLTQTTYYRLQFTSGSGCGVVYSNIIRDTVYPNIQAATITTTTINPVCYNTIPTAISIQTPASGGNSIFNNQWQAPISGVWTDITGETSNSYQSGQLIATTQYRLKSTSNYGCG